MGYNYHYYGDYAEMEMALAMFSGIALIVLLIVSIIGLLTYILSSLGTYTIAKRRGIKHPWLAWIPVANAWLLGSISDQYEYVVKGKVKNRRTVLLTLAILAAVLGSIASGSYASIVVNAILSGSDVLMEKVMTMTGAGFLSFGVSVAYMVFRYMALYDLYTSCIPENNVLFLVLSIIFNITEPFFVFACRNRDEGMPPRRVDDQTPNQPRPQPEPWDLKQE